MLSLLRSYFHTLKTYARWILLGLILIEISFIMRAVGPDLQKELLEITVTSPLIGLVISALLPWTIIIPFFSGISFYFFPLHRAYREHCSQWLEDFRKNREPTRFEVFKKRLSLTFLVIPLWSLLFIAVLLLIADIANQQTLYSSLFSLYGLSTLILTPVDGLIHLLFGCIGFLTFLCNRESLLLLLLSPPFFFFFILALFPLPTFPLSVEENTQEGSRHSQMQLFKRWLLIRLGPALGIFALLAPLFLFVSIFLDGMASAGSPRPFF